MRNDELGMYNLFVDVYAQLKDKTVLQVSMGVGEKTLQEDWEKVKPEFAQKVKDLSGDGVTLAKYKAKMETVVLDFIRNKAEDAKKSADVSQSFFGGASKSAEPSADHSADLKKPGMKK